MNLSPHHIVQQQIFDIHFKRREKYAALQNRFSRLFHDDLYRELENFLDTEISQHFNLRIESMTVDLGTVSYDNLEEEIKEIFIERFKKSLQEITGTLPAVLKTAEANEDEKTDFSAKYLEVADFFLATGILPWWAAGEEFSDPLKIIYELLQNQKNNFRELLYRIGTNETVRKRLAYQFPVDYIHAIIEILEPGKAAFIFQYHEEITKLHIQTHFAKAESKEIENAVWLFVFEFLLVSRGSVFEEKSFVRSSIYKMAMFFNVHYEELLTAFHKTLQVVKATEKKFSGLQFIIEDVYNDYFFHHDTITTPGILEEDEGSELLLLRKLKCLEYYFIHGSFLFEESSLTKDIVIAWMHELLDKIPALFITLLNNSAKETTQRERLFRIIDNTVLKKWITVLAAEHATVVSRYLELLTLFRKNSNAIKADSANEAILYEIAVASLVSFNNRSFDVKEFINEHLLHLSKTYTIDRKELLKLLMQAAIQQYGLESRNAVIIAGFIALLKEENNGGLLLQDNQYLHQSVHIEKEVAVNTRIELLKFYLHYGFLPWWTNEKVDNPAGRYIDELIEADTTSALLFLKHFEANEEVQQHFLLQISSAKLMQVFAKLPDAKKAFAVYEELFKLLQKSFIAEFISVENIRMLILQQFWNEYKTYGYKSFSTENFIISSIKHIAELLHTSALLISSHLQQIMQADNEKFSVLLKQEAFKASVAIYTHKKVSLDAEKFDTAVIIDRSLLNTETAIYFLEYNVLPPYINIEIANTGVFIKELFLIFLQYNAIALQRLFNSSNYNTKALLRLHQLFYAQKNIAERRLFNMLQEALEKIIPSRLQKIFGNNDGVIWHGKDVQKLITELTGLSNVSTDEHVDITAYVKNIILKVLLPDDNLTVKSAEQIFHEAIVANTKEEKIGEDKFLLELILQLYQQNPKIIKELAASVDEQENILFVHHLLSLKKNKDAKNLLNLLNEEINQIVVSYSEALAKIKFHYKEKYVEDETANVSGMTASIKPVEIIEHYSNRFTTNLTLEEAAQELLNEFFTAEDWQQIIPNLSHNDSVFLVKELMLIVYRKNDSHLKELLTHYGISPNRLEIFYALFINAQTIEERSIQHLLKTSAEKKSIEILKAKELITKETVYLNDAAKIIANQEDKKKFIFLLQEKESGGLLLQTISKYLDDDAIDKLLITSHPPDGKQIAFFAKSFRSLLQHVQLFSTDKSALLSLYKQFLLKFLAGKVHFPNLLTFIKVFFDYGEQYNLQLMLKFYLSLTNLLKQRINTSVLSFLLPQLEKETDYRIKLYNKKILLSAKNLSVKGKAFATDAALSLQVKNELELQKRLFLNKEQTKYTTLKKGEELEKIYVNNAGLVLLNPFLPVYFDRLNLLDNGKFIDQLLQQRAVHLLAYVTDGKEEHAEHSLPLNKILCGFSLNEPIDYAFDIKSNEKELSTQMLKVVFQRWEKLKNSTVEGFRDSFLKRQGILTRTKEGWNLRVEQRGYDILLDTIPWGFRFIKQSWMDATLTVEWM